MTREGVEFSIDVPAPGWTSNGSFLIRRAQGPRAAFIFWTNTPDGAYDDPCAHTYTPLVDASPRELAADITEIPGVDVVQPPTDVTIGGQPATHVAVTIPPGTSCGPGSEGFYLWYDEEIGGRWANTGTTVNAWIVDVEGQFVWFDAEVDAAGDPPVEPLVQHIVDSVAFE